MLGKSLKTYLSRQEWQNLPDDGIESLAYLSLFVHLHIQAIRHLVILQQEHSDASWVVQVRRYFQRVGLPTLHTYIISFTYLLY